MEYEKMDRALLVRLDPGEEILESLKKICAQENIETAMVSAIGAAKEVEMGVFNYQNKEYESHTYTGIYEIVSLNGNMSRMNGEPYPHLHIALADQNNQMLGGHLNRCIISATCEIVLELLEKEAGRKFSETVGLNLLSF